MQRRIRQMANRTPNSSQMAAKVTEIFKEMTRKEGITVLMTTHDVGLMGAADEIIELENGERING